MHGLKKRERKKEKKGDKNLMVYVILEYESRLHLFEQKIKFFFLSRKNKRKTKEGKDSPNKIFKMMVCKYC